MKRGLIGHPLGHSFSKGIHEAINNKEYHLFDLDYSEFDKFMTDKEFEAINVTIPYKEKVFKYLDFIHPKARKIGGPGRIRTGMRFPSWDFKSHASTCSATRPYGKPMQRICLQRND